MEDTEVSCSSVSECLTPAKKQRGPKIVHTKPAKLWSIIRNLTLTFNDINGIIEKELPKSAAVTGHRKVRCNMCPATNDGHMMNCMTRNCRDKKCKSHAFEDKKCEAQYKTAKCTVNDAARIWLDKSKDHLSEETNSINQRLINEYISLNTSKTSYIDTGSSESNSQPPSQIEEICINENKHELDEKNESFIDNTLEKETNKESENNILEKESAKKENKPVKRRNKKKSLSPVKKTKDSPNSLDAKKSFVGLFAKKTPKPQQQPILLGSATPSEASGGESTPTKATPKKDSKTPNIVPKKSAFDFLMSKKKAQLNESLKPNDSDSDVSLIVLDNSRSVCESPRAPSSPSFFRKTAKSTVYVEKNFVDNFINDPLFQTHARQYNNEEKDFLEIKTINNKLFKDESKIDSGFDVNSICLKGSLRLKIDASSIDNWCNCQEKLSELDAYGNEIETKFSQNSEDTSTASPSVERETKRRKTEKDDCNDTGIKRNIENELWTEKYQFKSENDIVTNNSQLERLKEWLENWKKLLAKQVPQKPGKKATKKGKKKYGTDSESEFYESDYSNYSNADSSCSNTPGRKFYSNALLLSGPHGCGKTSSVYAIAKLLGFKVFEVNSSSSRHKTQIIQELEGALNSHHVSNNQTNTNEVKKPENILTNLLEKGVTNPKETAKFKLDKFFNSANFENKMIASPAKEMREIQNEIGRSIDKKKSKKRKNSLRRETIHNLTNKINMNFSKNKIEDEDEDEDEKSDNDDFFSNTNTDKVTKKTHKAKSAPSPEPIENQSVNIQRESLILFDEIDVIFKEDVGFWSAILHFIKRSRKPILLTTSDEYLQDKMNLNVEKIDFLRPRINASVRYLKRIAKLENADLDTPTAYQILQNCGCDMRRALIQLQLQIVTKPKSQNSSIRMNSQSGANSTINLAKYLPDLLNCKHKNNDDKDKIGDLNAIFYLDHLSRNILPSRLTSEAGDDQLKRYDLILLKDGLSDANDGNSAFNPFIQVIPNNSHTEPIHDESDLVSTINNVRLEFYENFIQLFNGNRFIRFEDWIQHGHVNSFNFGCNAVLNRFAQYNFKLTTNQALCLDYRPYLQQICRYEEIKQQASGRRRYLHYLTHYNIGLVKEDFSLLARSALAPKLELVVNEEVRRKSTQKVKSYVETDLYSDGGA